MIEEGFAILMMTRREHMRCPDSGRRGGPPRSPQGVREPYGEGVGFSFRTSFLYTTLSALTCLVLWLCADPIQVAGADSVCDLFQISRDLGPDEWNRQRRRGVQDLPPARGQVAVHAVQSNPWVATANLFSNFYGGVRRRRFLLATLTAVFGFWPAAILSSVAFGAMRMPNTRWNSGDYLVVFGLTWCWLVRRTGSIWSAWIARMWPRLDCSTRSSANAAGWRGGEAAP